MDIQTARNHAKNRNYQAARDILLSLHDNDSCNTEIIRGLGKVHKRMNELDTSLIYYQIHQTIKPEALVYREIAEIYILTNQFTDAETMYNKALELDPYHGRTIHYKAKLMEKLNKHDQARSLYQDALRWTETEDQKARVYYDYASFIIHTLDDISAAQSILERALTSRSDDKLQQLYDYCLHHIATQKKKELEPYLLKNYRDIKLILFNFDDLLLKMGIALSPNMKWKEIINIFGGSDRIQILRDHFAKLRHINVQLVLISDCHEDIVTKILPRELMSFFDGVEGLYTFPEKYKLDRQNICYISLGKYIDIVHVRKYCQILYINPYDHCILPGLKIIDLQYIECIFHINAQTIFYEDFPFEVPQSMIQHNTNVYRAIQTEIETEGLNKTVQELPVFKWIKSEEFSEYKACYIDFCYKFGDAWYAMNHRRSYWAAANWIYQLVVMEGNDWELHGMYAKCLSHLHLDIEAEKHYRISLSLKQDSYTYNESFAEHLLNKRRNEEAIYHFDVCIQLKKFNGGIDKAYFYSKYAKANHFCGRSEIAEKNYKLALEFDNKKNPRDTARFHADFGLFLMSDTQLSAARKQYEAAIQLDAKNGYIHWKLSCVLFKMGLKEEHVKPLKKALKIDCNLQGARRDYHRYFGKEYDNDDDESKEEERNYDRNRMNDRNNLDECDKGTFSAPSVSTTLSKYHPKNKWQNEFNQIYLNKFRNKTEKERFKGYLNEMIFKNLNDIRMVLKYDVNVLTKQMKHKININNVEDLKKISQLFEEIKEQHYVFKAFCDANQIDKTCREEILEKNGVFSVEAIRSIKKQDLMNMISDNEMGGGRGNKQFVDRVWGLISQIQQMSM